MTDSTNYGILVGYATSGSTYTNIASLYNVGVPTISNPEIESTNHGSGGYKTFIPSNLVEVGEFKLGVGWDSTDISGSFVTWTKTGTNLLWQITFPNARKWNFAGFIKEFAPTDFDATSPALHMADLTIRSTGSIVLS